ncbi:hypothetical protein GcC1_141015 [Golovinomyces cichoracearum]|uniref:Uncharacterized protein n=1 Tax=Golovinomyces cichoracearum TaxID=62708 RepID=A0A420I099_9PEZI|nr:hypothetical protein GcC1_141015 [Golovinomyces cichoracearum]
MTNIKKWKKVEHSYNIYAQASGAALNTSKTKIVQVNTNHTFQNYRGVQLVDSATYLGVTIGFVWKVEDGKIVKGPIKNTDSFRPIKEGGIKLCSLKCMRDSLVYYRIQKLEESIETDPIKRQQWFSLANALIMKNVTPDIRNLTEHPWIQKWTCRIPKPPPSVYQFLFLRNKSLTNIPPKSLMDVATTNFWIHPCINSGHANVRWGAPIWKELFNGTDEVDTIRSIGQLWNLKEGNGRFKQKHRIASMRLINHLPPEWLNFLIGVPHLLRKPDLDTY